MKHRKTRNWFGVVDILSYLCYQMYLFSVALKLPWCVWAACIAALPALLVPSTIVILLEKHAIIVIVMNQNVLNVVRSSCCYIMHTGYCYVFHSKIIDYVARQLKRYLATYAQHVASHKISFFLGVLLPLNKWAWRAVLKSLPPPLPTLNWAYVTTTMQ